MLDATLALAEIAAATTVGRPAFTEPMRPQVPSCCAASFSIGGLAGGMVGGVTANGWEPTPRAPASVPDFWGAGSEGPNVAAVNDGAPQPSSWFFSCSAALLLHRCSTCAPERAGGDPSASSGGGGAVDVSRPRAKMAMGGDQFMGAPCGATLRVRDGACD